MPSHRSWALAVAAIIAAVASGGHAAAQTAEGFALDRWDPSERGSAWFSGESLDFDGHLAVTAGLWASWGLKPLVAYDAGDNEQAAIVEHQLTLHPGATVVLRDWLRFGLSVPVAAFQDGETTVVGGTTFEAPGPAFGDIRLGVDARFLGAPGDVVRLAGGLQLHLPTGSQGDYTSDGTVRLHPRVMVAGDAGILAYSARLGVFARFRDAAFGDEDFGSELTFVATAGVKLLDDRVLVGPEVHGSTVLSDPFDGGVAPFELLLGGHADVGAGFRPGLAIGPGLTQGLGAPQLRVILGLEWSPPQPAKKPAPAAPEPAPPQLAAADRKPADGDGDGIPDLRDACPETKGVANDDLKQHGCPPPPPPAELKDSDGDGIDDLDDACPQKKGPKQEDAGKNGCPAPVVAEASPWPRLQGIQFRKATAKFRPESIPLLKEVARVMEEHPEFEKVHIVVHTDDRGSKVGSMVLSRARADAIFKWLINHGVNPRRLKAIGRGREEPVAPNDTEENRARNRRVAFEVVKEKTGE